MSVQEEESRDGLGIRRGDCYFCSNPVDKDDPDLYRQVTSWVHGPKLDSPKLREQTGLLAHSECVMAVVNGQPPNEEPLF